MTRTVLSELCELKIDELDTAVGGTSIKFDPEPTRWAKGGGSPGEIYYQQTVDLLTKALGA